MKRIALSDGSGKWFDEDRVQQEWESDGDWHDIHVQRQRLFLTAGGSWVLQFVPTFDKEVTSYKLVTAEEAAQWLILNQHSLPDALVADAAKSEI